MTRYPALLLSLTFSLLVLTGCGSLSGLSSSPEARAFISEYRNIPPRSLTAGGTLTLDAGLEEQLTVPIQYINHSDLGVSLSVRPLGVMEAVRVTVTDKEVLVLDRLNKRYARASLDGLSTQIASSLLGFNPYALKAFLGNEPFSEKAQGPSSLSKLRYAGGEGIYKFYEESPRIELLFNDRRELTRSYYEPAVNTSLQADYSEFAPLGTGGRFPMRTNLTVEMGIKDYHFDLNLENLRPYAGQEITTVPPSGYSEISIGDMWDILGFVSKILF